MSHDLPFIDATKYDEQSLRDLLMSVKPQQTNSTIAA